MFKVEGFIDKYFPEAEPYGNPVTDMSVNCPFCNDTKRHLKISLEKETCHCFRCDYKASWIKLVRDVTGLSYYNAINELYYKPRLSDEKSILAKFHEENNTIDRAGSLAKLPSDFELLYLTDNPTAGILRGYIKRRGFSDYHIRKYGLGMSGIYPMRVIIPIEKGYWQGRSIFSWLEPKYVNPKANVRSIIFNAQALEKFDEIVVCEGVFSAMAVGANAIALLGKEVTKEKQQRILNSNVKKIIVALESGAFDSMQPFMDKAVARSREVVVWKFNTGDPADSTDFEVMNYSLRTKIDLRLGG